MDTISTFLFGIQGQKLFFSIFISSFIFIPGVKFVWQDGKLHFIELGKLFLIFLMITYGIWQHFQ